MCGRDGRRLFLSIISGKLPSSSLSVITNRWLTGTTSIHPKNGRSVPEKHQKNQKTDSLCLGPHIGGKQNAGDRKQTDHPCRDRSLPCLDPVDNDTGGYRSKT